MEYKKFNDKYFLRIDKGEEIVSVLKEFCEKENIELGTLHGIGAANDMTIGLFSTEDKKYISKQLKGDYEIIPLMGNITTMDGEIYLHLHINVCDSSNNSYGGHLNQAIVSATFECVVEKMEGTLDREKDPDIGLNLLKFD